MNKTKINPVEGSQKPRSAVELLPSLLKQQVELLTTII
jgi:hypothetical protein